MHALMATVMVMAMMMVMVLGMWRLWWRWRGHRKGTWVKFRHRQLSLMRAFGGCEGGL